MTACMLFRYRITEMNGADDIGGVYPSHDTKDSSARWRSTDEESAETQQALLQLRHGIELRLARR